MNRQCLKLMIFQFSGSIYGFKRIKLSNLCVFSHKWPDQSFHKFLHSFKIWSCYAAGAIQQKCNVCFSPAPCQKEELDQLLNSLCNVPSSEVSHNLYFFNITCRDFVCLLVLRAQVHCWTLHSRQASWKGVIEPIQYFDFCHYACWVALVHWYAFNSLLLIKHNYLQEKKAQDLQHDYNGLSEHRHRCTRWYFGSPLVLLDRIPENRHGLINIKAGWSLPVPTFPSCNKTVSLVERWIKVKKGS